MTSFTAFIPAWPANLAVSAIFSFLVFSSCSDPATVGLELAPGNNQIGVFYEEFELDSKVVLLDSFRTTNTGMLVVGNETDDYFGKTDSKGYSRMYINPTATRPGTDAILDSMYFSLTVKQVYGLNLDQPKKYAIHRLTESILDTAYYNFDRLAYEPDPIASVEVTFGEVTDTTFVFPVTEAFAEEFFGKMQAGREFSGLFTFREYFPGIAYLSREGDHTTIGVAPGSTTAITAYYHNPGDTTAKNYAVTTGSSRYFYGVSSDRSGTPTEVVTDYQEAYETGTRVGMKSGLGLALKIDTSPLDSFLDTLSGIVFNQVLFETGEIVEKAEGQIPINRFSIYFTNDSNKFIRNANNIPYSLQRTGQIQITEDSQGNSVLPVNTPAIAVYSSVEKDYAVDITSYVNAVFREGLSRNDWLLYGAIVGDGSEEGDFKISLKDFKVDKNKIKIKVIYSKSR